VTEALANTSLRAPAPEASLLGLSEYVGPPSGFWSAYLQRLLPAFGASAAWVMVRQSRQPWQVALNQGLGPAHSAAFAARLLQAAQQALEQDTAWLPHEQEGELLAASLPVSPEARAPQAVLLLWFDADVAAQKALLGVVLPFALQIPQDYQQGQLRRQLQGDSLALEKGVRRLYDVLDLAQRLGQEQHFVQLAMMLCNELSTRFQADRVSLAWVHDSHIKLIAISHVENFDKKANATRDLIAAMEEGLDQQVVVAFPSPDGQGAGLSRAHESFVRLHGVGALTTVPVWLGDEVLAMLAVERSSGALTGPERWEMGLLVRAVARVLRDVRAQDRWFWLRWKDAAFKALGAWVGPRHIGMKLGIAAALAAVAVLTFLPWTHRVQAQATLKSEHLLFAPAPFDGYLADVEVKVGDVVQADQVLLRLATQDLRLEAQVARAEQVRFQRELERAQGARDLSAVQIALAKQQQAQARLAQVEHQLQQATLRAPFTGVVVEGDLRQNLGAPVRRGDLLIKLARLDELSLELSLPEEDAHFVQPGASGEVAFVGRPEARFAFVLTDVEPVANTVEGKNVVRATADLGGEALAWWRPGMGGTAKVDVGERPLWWVLSHKALNRLREYFWL
jgi:multidrug efflux pump subunit AcrA (membrane-fusion protein)